MKFASELVRSILKEEPLMIWGLYLKLFDDRRRNETKGTSRRTLEGTSDSMGSGYKKKKRVRGGGGVGMYIISKASCTTAACLFWKLFVLFFLRYPHKSRTCLCCELCISSLLGCELLCATQCKLDQSLPVQVSHLAPSAQPRQTSGQLFPRE